MQSAFPGMTKSGSANATTSFSAIAALSRPNHLLTATAWPAPVTSVIVIGSAWAGAEGKNQRTTSANNWTGLDVEDIGENTSITSLLAG